MPDTNYLAVQTSVGTLPTYSFPSGYDQNKLGLGSLMIQSSGTGESNWVGPSPVGVARPVETAGAIPGNNPTTVRWSPNIDWVFLSDGAAAAATRRFQLFTFDRTASVNQWSWKGFITCTLPFSGTQGTYVVRSISPSYETYTQGTVTTTANSTTIVGNTTSWVANRMFVGSRIGFGTTTPYNVSTWYEISSILDDSRIVLTQTYAQSTTTANSYVLEDLRLLWVATNGTSAFNAGLFMTAGLRFDNFSVSGVNVPAASTTDRIRANYWLGDGGTISNSNIQTYGGLDLDTKSSWTSQTVYCLDCPASNSRFQVNNFRATLTLVSGRDSGTWILNTGQQAVTGAVSQNANLVLCTPNHGPRSGQKTLFWVTASRFYSAVTSGITSGNTTFQSGASVEVPPGGSNTFPLTAALSSICYSSSLDRFYIFTTSVRHYLTQYKEDSSQWDRVILINNGQTNQSIVDNTIAIYPANLASAVVGDAKGGVLYLLTPGTTAITNLLYSIPTSVDWEFTNNTNARVVFPVMDTSRFSGFVAGFMNCVEVVGGKTGTNLGIEPGAVRMYYRTSGISDNSGSWTLLDYTGDMSQVPAASSIQAMLEFRILTWFTLPGRITRVGFVGTGSSSDNHYQFSYNYTDLNNKRFAFRHAVAFGSTVPTLYMRIYDAVTNTLLVSDNTASPTGTWEKSTTSVASWGSYDSVDKANETTYIRYTPASIADNVNALPVLGLS